MPLRLINPLGKITSCCAYPSQQTDVTKILPYCKSDLIWVLLVPTIVLRLLEEQANTISKVKVNKIGFRVLAWKFHKQEGNIKQAKTSTKSYKD